MKTVVSALLLTASVTTYAAFADDAVGQDEVILKNGGSIRGTVISVEPGNQVVILEMGMKEPKTLPWADVADVEKNRYPASAGGGSANVVQGGPNNVIGPNAEGSSKAVTVHIQSPKRVQLLEEVGEAVGYADGDEIAISQIRTACASPCDRVIDGSRGQAFAIAGDGVTPSRSFTLNDRGGDVRIDVDPGSSGVRTGGVFLAIFGGSSILVGAVTLPLGFVLESSATSVNQFGATQVDNTGANIGNDMKIAGGVLLGAGVAMLASSIGMIVASKTSIDIRNGSARADLTPRKPRYWAGEF